MRDKCDNKADGNKTDMRGLDSMGRCCNTYNDDAADEHEVPYQILFLGEFRIAPFQLAQIVIHEIRVKEHSQVFRRYEEARYQSVDRRRELEEHRIMEEETIWLEHACPDADGRDEHSCRHGPTMPMLVTVNTNAAWVPVTNLATGGVEK